MLKEIKAETSASIAELYFLDSGLDLVLVVRLQSARRRQFFCLSVTYMIRRYLLEGLWEGENNTIIQKEEVIVKLAKTMTVQNSVR